MINNYLILINKLLRLFFVPSITNLLQSIIVILLSTILFVSTIVLLLSV